MKKPGPTESQSAAELIDKWIAELGDWRGETLSRLRKLLKRQLGRCGESGSGGRGTPIWPYDASICTGESYESIVKLTFAKGLYRRTRPSS